MLNVVIDNGGGALTVDEYVILDVYQQYFFWPGWTGQIDYRTRDLWAGGYYDEKLLDFVWPEGAGAASGIVFWAALLYHDTSYLAAPIDQCSFGYSG